jgi:hypothetical protein
VVSALHAFWNQPQTAATKAETVTDLTALYQSGKRTEGQTLAALEELGYSAADAQAKLDVLGARRIVAEQTRVITAAHKAFIDGSLTGAQANELLQDLGVDEPTRTSMLVVWGLQSQFGV